ncbi:pyruvate kinase-like isoform X2 [Mytilus edulis]|uniref:pyruvate kinase-like isoform X2 n=1 Tax=Mytilus edulis TaxID=6550 RepID=UPI0039EF8A80
MSVFSPFPVGDSVSGRLDQLCKLDIDCDQHELMGKMTGIIGTIGPACDSVEMLTDMFVAGLNICRMNLAYRTHQYFADIIKRIHQIVPKIGHQIAIGTDITGPGIRLGYLKGEVGLGQELKMAVGDKMRFTSDPTYRECGTPENMFVEVGEAIDRVQIGNQVIIEDGPLTFKVTAKGKDYVDCCVEEPGELGGRMLWTIPRLILKEPKLSVQDKQELDFALEHHVDMIFASFVYDPALVHEIREYLGERGKTMKIVSKIENYEGIKRYDEILEVSDGIMVARGNLGIDISPEKVFIAQKMMIGRANNVGKPVICATQMLASMIQNPRPTRAEVADVANAVIDGADCVMLSRETARGKNPLKSLQTICNVSREAEQALYRDQLFHDLRVMVESEPTDATHTAALSAVEAAMKCHARAIVVITATGRSAALIAKYRPPCVIIAITRFSHTARSLHLHRGVLPILYQGERTAEWINDVDNRINNGLMIAKELQYIDSGDICVLVTGWTAGTGRTNTVRIITCPTSESPQMYVRIHGSMSEELLDLDVMDSPIHR